LLSVGALEHGMIKQIGSVRRASPRVLAIQPKHLAEPP
jgi:hypothetical protein